MKSEVVNAVSGVREMADLLEETSFTSRLVAEIVGMDHGALRSWKQLGYLPVGVQHKKGGWNRFTVKDVYLIAIMKQLTKVGISPKFAGALAILCGAAFLEDEAFRYLAVGCFKDGSFAYGATGRLRDLEAGEKIWGGYCAITKNGMIKIKRPRKKEEPFPLIVFNLGSLVERVSAEMKKRGYELVEVEK